MRDGSIDLKALTREVVQELRGRQTGMAASRRLGFQTNVFARWESGERIPHADDVLRFAHISGRPVLTSIGNADLGERTPRDAAFVPTVMQSMVAQLGRAKVAAATGMSSHQLGRVCRGQTRLRLPDLYRFLAAYRWLVPHLVQVSDPTRLPALEEAWIRHDRLTALVSEVPFLHALCESLHLDAYRALPAHSDAWLATHLKLEEDLVRRVIKRAAFVGAIDKDGEHYTYDPQQGLARHRLSEGATRRIGAELARVAADRIETREATMAWRFFRCTEEGVAEISRSLEAGFAAAETLADGGSGQRIALATVQLMPLDGRPIE